MIKIEYPEYSYKIEFRDNKKMIFDIVRKLWVNLTPEEWVRQNFLQYLIQVKQYPPALISVEKEIYLGELKKRCDIVIYNRNGEPYMLVECKAMDVALSTKTIDQVLRYNISIPVNHIIITNGAYCFAFERTNEKFAELRNIPSWKN
ncbi:MAG: type I restriction enzyme HsdR N-terminal domain-containing protein [Chitinophagaceae bacterium]|nr:type I restriction enzyme HsdR N-terminal domain-containing protein [Chitinophagaceae bacterium]